MAGADGGFKFLPAWRCLVTYFGAGKPLGNITRGDADAWRIWLGVDQKLGDNTVRRRCSIARQFLRNAVRRKLIQENPFGDLRDVGVKGNRSREFFITLEMAAQVLEACPDAEWRLLFALSRYGGLRCPSEHLALRWNDVDWERGRMRVTSPKTAHHVGHGERWVPIFAELRPYMDAAFDDAEDGAEFVIARYRDPRVNLRSRLTDIIYKAGLTPWSKLWHNLRATRETELAESYPIHVVCQWIGNSEAVAKRHYLQVTDEHFAQAARGEQLRTTQAKHEAKHDPKQNAKQQALRESVPERQPISGNAENAGNCEGVTLSGIVCKAAESRQVGAAGLDIVAIPAEKRAFLHKAAVHAAVFAANPQSTTI
jgi:integrase